jgi:hypothetical protein
VGDFDGFHAGVVLEEPLDDALVFAGGEGASCVEHVPAGHQGSYGIAKDAALATDVFVDFIGEETLVGVFTFGHERLPGTGDIADDEVKGLFELFGVDGWVGGPDAAALDFATVEVGDEGSRTFADGLITVEDFWFEGSVGKDCFSTW